MNVLLTHMIVVSVLKAYEDLGSKTSVLSIAWPSDDWYII